jgi:hypothetical protein
MLARALGLEQRHDDTGTPARRQTWTTIWVTATTPQSSRRARCDLNTSNCEPVAREILCDVEWQASCVITLSEPSVQSVFLIPMGRSHSIGTVDLATGTGFFVRRGRGLYLVTNYHVASGRHPDTGQAMHRSGLVTEFLMLTAMRPIAKDRIEWDTIEVSTVEAGANGVERALWLEHPAHGRLVDVVAIPIDDSIVSGYDIRPYDLEAWVPSMPLQLGVGGDVSIVGFPFGKPASGAFAVWTHGFLASEPLVDYEGRPRFLIDAKTREGQSGAPVIVHNPSPLGVDLDGKVQQLGGAVTQLIGVYSGRVNLSEDIGFVWRAQAIVDIIDSKQPGHTGVIL